LAYINSGGKFRLKPDIVINHGTIIADTKWKILDSDKTHQGVAQADMYQLYAYGKKYKDPRCEDLYLIYPKSEQQAHETCYSFSPLDCDITDLKLHVIFFDLENKCFTSDELKHYF
jgi:5-methylcytosine-specific restriction enzyme subunit McrC